jgi:hypothetical protein
MNVTIEIKAPGLEAAITLLAGAISAQTGQAAPTPEPAKKVTAKKAAKKTAKVVEAEEVPVVTEPDVPEITQKELVTLAKKLCEVTGGNQKVLRATLDNAGIEGEKISTCEASFYPAIKEGIEAAIADNDM